MTIRTEWKFRLFEALQFLVISPILFAICNAAGGESYLISRFETGAIFGVVTLKLIESVRAYSEGIGERSRNDPLRGS